MKNQKFTDAHLEAYASYIKQDYEKWSPNGFGFLVEFQPGSKYVRVVTINGASSSAHSFIDINGNIWKAASWKAPAQNFIRGSIMTGDFSRVSWTGAR